MPPLRGRTCNIVADRDCKAPANLEGANPALRTECFRCGEGVCTSHGCSRRVTYMGKRRRLCDDCIQEEKRW